MMYSSMPFCSLAAIIWSTIKQNQFTQEIKKEQNPHYQAELLALHFDLHIVMHLMASGLDMVLNHCELIKKHSCYLRDKYYYY